MAEPKHTPGPWMAASAASSVVGLPVVGRQGRAIASVHCLPGKSDEPAEIAYRAECAANARLIAAAPALLAACRAALGTMRHPTSAQAEARRLIEAALKLAEPSDAD